MDRGNIFGYPQEVRTESGKHIVFTPIQYEPKVRQFIPHSFSVCRYRVEGATHAFMVRLQHALEKAIPGYTIMNVDITALPCVLTPEEVIQNIMKVGVGVNSVALFPYVDGSCAVRVRCTVRFKDLVRVELSEAGRQIDRVVFNAPAATCYDRELIVPGDYYVFSDVLTVDSPFAKYFVIERGIPIMRLTQENYKLSFGQIPVDEDAIVLELVGEIHLGNGTIAKHFARVAQAPFFLEDDTNRDVRY